MRATEAREPILDLITLGSNGGAATGMDPESAACVIAASAATAYVALDDEFDNFQYRVYLESNGEAGLQRGGYDWMGNIEVCDDSTNPDEFVFVIYINH